MMKKSFLLVAAMAAGMASAQYTGKVGVNTATPTKTLDVNGNFQTVSALTSDGITDGIETNAVSNNNQGILVYSVKGAADDLFSGNIANSALLVQPDRSSILTNDENNNSSQLEMSPGQTSWTAYSQSPDGHTSKISEGANGINGQIIKNNTSVSDFALTNTGFAVSNSGLSNITSTLTTFGSFSAPIRKMNGAVTGNDYTILGTGNCTLPSPATAQGRIYNFMYDGIDYSISGSLRLRGAVIPSYDIKATNSKITIQSDGNNWVILL